MRDNAIQLDDALEGVLRRDRTVVSLLLCAVIAASWVYILLGAGMGMGSEDMAGMSGMEMGAPAWTPTYVVVMFFMWWIMMIAMMLPSATPMILLFAVMNRRQRQKGNSSVSTAIFTASYLLAWAGFSLLALLGHWLLDASRLLTADMVVDSAMLSGALLLAAGIYQFTPIKRACLRHCRLPAMFLAQHWRPGTAGAVVMGMRHGAFCLGCCWFLMLLLFVGGVMNLYWIVGLAIYVLIEKSITPRYWIEYGVGALLVAAGAWLLAVSTL